MPKSSKRDQRIQHADHRRRTNTPGPEIAAIRDELLRQLTPATFAQARAGHTHLNLRDRLLNLPTMCAIVLSLVSRQIPSLHEVLRVLAREGLLWVEAINVSVSALSKRFEKLPAAMFATLFEQMLLNRTQRPPQQQAEQQTGQGRANRMPTSYACVWIADGSTLEQLRKTTAVLREQPGAVLGGKLMMIVEADSHRPVRAFFEEDAHSNDKRFNDQLIEALPVGGLLVLDAGFFSFELFDAFSDAGTYFVTRMRAKTAYRSIEVLSRGEHYRDEIIEVGLYRSDPARHRLRLVSVQWGKTWYQYLSNEVDADRLSAEQVAQLYRQRWRIEEAFLLTKRLLGLSYLWVGSSNGVQIQVYATLIFYSVLVELCEDVAEQLSQPLDRISVEMVFRGLYHYSRAVGRDEQIEVVAYLCEHAKLLGIVKAERKRHRQHDAQLEQIWTPA